jgi:hypothetical protein
MTPELYDALDAEIGSVLPPERLITPDDVPRLVPHARGRGARRQLAALSTTCSGRVMLTARQQARRVRRRHESLDRPGRVRRRARPVSPTPPSSRRTTPRGDNLARIQDEVRQGYLIRTRADDPVTTPMSGDVTQRDAALASGAQWVEHRLPGAGMTARFDVDRPTSP